MQFVLLFQVLLGLASSDKLVYGHKQDYSLMDGESNGSLKTKLCSAWSDSYYRTFDGRDFVLLGNCNYTFVQTTCPGVNASVPLQIKIARAYLNSATVSTIHTVQISIKDLSISIVREEKNYVRVDGQKRNLPVSLKNGSLNFYPSGSNVILITSIGLTLLYDWAHHLQVEVGTELYGTVCGLCGDAKDGSIGGSFDSNGTEGVDFPLPWVLNSGTESCIEDCVGSSCSLCTQSQTRTHHDAKGNSFGTDCSLLNRNDGPFADCHGYIDPAPFERSCVNQQCIGEAAASLCKVLKAYANICQMVGARVQNWRSIMKCSMTCPMNSHYEICGSACPATCGNPVANHNCSLPCVESCQCNKGYLLSGGKCVAHTNCGCSHNDSYYLPKESFWIGQQCQEKCVCQTHTKKVECAVSLCRAGEVCKVLNGVLGCYMEEPGLCIANGNHHYTTFDGKNFDIHGNCSYLLTSHCPTWGDLDDFDVEVHNQINEATSMSSWHIKIVVSGYLIAMSYGWNNRVKVNGLLLRVPLVLSKGKVKLYMAGNASCLETDFGLVVTYNSDTLTVQMPRIYSGNLCGLCGNFNANPDDDPMQDIETNISQAIRQWRVSSECLNVPLNTTSCSSQETALYRGNDFCGRLLDPDGAFQNCHKALDPYTFYENCVYDLCNDHKTLCQILSRYVAICQEMGSVVYEWRVSNFCALSCPTNSEYQLCSQHLSDCVETPHPLAVKCKEGCFCKPGFFHSGGQCIPESKCGCMYDNIYYEIHETFHPDRHCHLYCVCIGHNQLQCIEHACPIGTHCTILDGVRACHESESLLCRVMGGRYFRTYDAQTFDFNMGSCRYVLSQTCGNESGPTVVVQRDQVDLRVYGVTILLEMEHSEKIKVNGVQWRLPIQLDHIAVFNSGSLTRVVVDTGVIVTYGWPKMIQIEIPAASRGKMCGLCGINTAVTAGDGRQSLNGSLRNYSMPASFWSLSPPAENCNENCDQCTVCNSSMAARFASHGFCGLLLAPVGPFNNCHNTVDPEPYFQHCVKELCMSSNEQSLCSSLRAYTYACQDAGAEVKPWRGDKCLFICPEHSHYNVCVNSCAESCGVLSDIPCPWSCYEGCQCDSGYMQSGNGCVRSEQCGCFYNGHYYEIGQMLWAEGCSQQCNCSAPATMCCEPASCPEGQSCTLNDTWGCSGKVMSCPANSHYESCGSACSLTCEALFSSLPCNLTCVEGCQCNQGFVLDGDICVPSSQCGCTYNASHYHSNETFWADDACTEQCVCDPHTHQLHCSLASCGLDEYCDLQDGIRSCVVNPQKSCFYTGSHIFTFDQRSYDFHGTCQYKLLGICQQSLDLEAIEVHVQTDGHLLSLVHVLVTVSGKLVELNSKNTEKIEVNGVRKNMPYRLSPHALVFSLGLHTYIYTDHGFILSIGIEGIVSIHLSSNYANATCGLCGDFNSNPADDLTVNGTMQNVGPEYLGKAWRSGQDPWCVEGCLGGSCPKCSSDHLAHYSDLEACGKILEVNGPFRHCHGKVDPSSFYKHCVSDLCLHGDLQHALCRSLAEYASVCHSHKATVYAWRSPGFCQNSCPDSTTYDTSSAPVHLCLGWRNNTFRLPLNAEENCHCDAGLVHSGSLCVRPEKCGCFYHGEYLQEGQKVSTCQQSCVCHSGGHLTCHDVSCREDEECKFISGVQGCHSKAKVAYCSVDGSHYSTFDGQAFKFHGSCNYTLVDTCFKKINVEPILITIEGNYAGRRIHLQVNTMTFKMSVEFPGKILVNGVYENLPFSQNNVTVYQKNDWRILRVTESLEITSNLRSHIQVKISDIYHQTTCGLCGNYNDNHSDDMQLPNGTKTSDSIIFGLSWKHSDPESSCSDICDDNCQLCQSSIPEYTSDLYCGLVTQPSGPFASCHHLVCPQKYYSLCLESLCMASGGKWALCDVLQAFEAACERAGAMVNFWRNITGCAGHCPEFSHFTGCANVCSSLCAGIRQTVQCPTACQEGCQCDDQHFYDGHACVPATECGCVHEGRTFKASESRLLHNCTVKCTCGPPLVCEQHSCPPLHSCIISNGTAGCHKDEHNQDPCGGKCDESEKCFLSNGVPVCVSRHGVCWAWGSQQYSTFDGLRYSFDGACTYLLAGSKGAACGLTPFMVSIKNGGIKVFAKQVVTVRVYGFIIKLGSKNTIYVNSQLNYAPLTLLRGKIKISSMEDKVLLRTDFGMKVVCDSNATVIVTLDPHYQGNVYGLCGNFNGNPQDEYSGLPLIKTSIELAQAYRLFDGDQNCCTGCNQNAEKINILSDSLLEIKADHRRQCEPLKDVHGPSAHCQNRVDAHSLYQHCIINLVKNGGSKVALGKVLTLYSMICEGPKDDYSSGISVGVHCPPHSHYKTCGSACPPTCQFNSNARLCTKICISGCFCDPGFIMSPRGCVLPQQCGCTDSGGRYHSLNSTFWIPDECGQVCVCGPAEGAVHCSPSQCPRGMVCNKLHHKRICQPMKPLNCTVTTGLHFKTFDGHHFDFRSGCAFSLVHTTSDLIGLTPFNITISDASCHKRLYHSQSLTLSIYGLKVTVSKEYQDKVLVDGLYRSLPYSNKTAHIDVHHTASSLVIHVDMGLQLIVYKTGTFMISMPSSYRFSVAGLCGNANINPYDDLMMSNDELAQNAQEFAHSWRLDGTEACKSTCPSILKKCPPEVEKLFEGSDFCGILLNELGPFADCASVLNPKPYFHNCVADSCSYGGHHSALCNSIASYAAACQAAQLPVRHWRSETFCGMLCPKNSHYELCGPRCPDVCAGPFSPAYCVGGCEEGCHCDPGYVLSDGECVLISDCGCMHNGQYYPAGLYYHGKTCQRCKCKGAETCNPSPCRPMERFVVNADLGQYRSVHDGVCEVFSGFGYITFDGVVLPHYGACTFLVSQLTSQIMHDYSLLLSFEKSGNVSVFTISRVELQLLTVEVSIDPKTLWKIHVNGEKYIVPFANGMLKVISDGHRLVLTTVAGVKLEISSTQYLRLTVPQDYNSAASGLCGNFNGDRPDDLEQSNGQLARSFSEFLHSWTVGPRDHCTETCGEQCDQCSLPPQSMMACNIMLVTSIEFRACRNSGVDHNIYRNMCITAVCSGAKRIEAACLAMEAYAAACQDKGINTGSWRRNTPCSFRCPDRSSASECVDSAASSCSALLQPWSPPAGCSSGCQCLNGNVFDGEKCVPYSQCGCVLHGRYIQLDEKLYNDDCTQRCWCHPQSGVLCERVACSPGQHCALRNGAWGCHNSKEVCKLKGALQVTTLGGQQLNMESNLSYTLMSLCDETSEKWFHVISYYGPCEESSNRLTTVFKILMPGTSIVLQRGTVKVNGLFVSLPHVLPSGVSLTLDVSPDKEVLVIMKKDVLMETELQIKMSATMATVEVAPWYSGQLCGLCGNVNDLYSPQSVKSWVLPNYDGCDD